jgi:hypothetical protein
MTDRKRHTKTKANEVRAGFFARMRAMSAYSMVPELKKKESMKPNLNQPLN